ncbi:MAG TPA: glycosyltransferase [Acidimicrobiia bacterium]|nr:glycosyltransferase [Acidimicrobiia bacterium]
MTAPTVLILTTVHHPDDPRIREKLARTLVDGGLEVAFATREPGPSDPEGLRWLPLRGGRLARNLAAWRAAFTTRYHLLSLHDPETLPLGLAVAWLRRRPVIFDVHENVPELAMQRTWVPAVLRRPVRWLLRTLLTTAERSLHITLAEPGYQSLFRRTNPVFPNYLSPSLPPVLDQRDGYAVYVGDVTEARGIGTAVVAAVRAGLPLRVVGSVSDDLRRDLAAEAGDSVVFEGRLPHFQAMEIAARAVVGMSPLRDLPNYRHSLPTKVIEYLALGVPVVASDLPGTREAVRGLESVELVPPDNSEMMAAAMGRAAATVEKAISQAPEIRERYQWPAEEVRAFYRSLLPFL